MDPANPPALTPLHLTARQIPIPTHISQAARAFLDFAGQAPPTPEPTGTTQQEWDDAAAAWNARILPGMEAILAQIPMALETQPIAQCHIHIATPPDLPAARQDYAFIDIHGGGLVFGAGRFAQAMAIFRAASLGVRVISIDYRVPPAHPYPAALDDCLAVYRHILQNHTPAQIAVSGLSAGGNLAAAMLLRARDEDLPLPAAALLMTPELDLTESGDSFATNRTIDVALPAGLPRANALYAGAQDLAHPYISPLFGDFTRGFPPAFLQTGTRDLFLSNTVRMHRALLRAKHHAELHVWEAMPHAGFGGATPEDVEMQTAMRDFLVRVAGMAPVSRQPIACVVVIGNEVLSGRTQDANIRFLATRLGDLGIPVREVRIIPDVAETIIRTIVEVRAAFDHVFTTGGIGPTHDDITSECIAAAFGVPWEKQPIVWARMEAHYPPGDFNAARQRMATMPRGATLIDNGRSIAPGFSIGNVHVMAGVPAIMRAMFDMLAPTLQGGSPIISRSVHAGDIREGDIAAGLTEIQARFPALDLGSYPYFREGGAGVAIVAKGTDENAAEAAIAEVSRLFRTLGGDPCAGEPA